MRTYRNHGTRTSNNSVNAGQGRATGFPTSGATYLDNRQSIRHAIVGRQGIRLVHAPKPDLLQGTLDLLILKSLALGSLHGWAISKRIQQMSSEVLTVNQGSLYPALYRLEDRGWIAGKEALSAEGRRIKVYRLTALGRRQLADEIKAWGLFARAIDHVVGAT
jgi:PadR family transcriptional regulator PadR